MKKPIIIHISHYNSSDGGIICSGLKTTVSCEYKKFQCAILFRPLNRSHVEKTGGDKYATTTIKVNEAVQRVLNWINFTYTFKRPPNEFDDLTKMNVKTKYTLDDLLFLEVYNDQ